MGRFAWTASSTSVWVRLPCGNRESGLRPGMPPSTCEGYQGVPAGALEHHFEGGRFGQAGAVPIRGCHKIGRALTVLTLPRWPADDVRPRAWGGTRLPGPPASAQTPRMSWVDGAPKGFFWKGKPYESPAQEKRQARPMMLAVAMSSSSSASETLPETE